MQRNVKPLPPGTDARALAAMFDGQGEGDRLQADLHYNALKASGELDRRRDAEALRIQVAFGNANLPEFLR